MQDKSVRGTKKGMKRIFFLAERKKLGEKA